MTSDQLSATLTTPAPNGPDDPRPARSLAPDLARGALLLFIALANVGGYLWTADQSTTLDRVVDGVTAFFVDDRSRPMFAILYGFGLATIAARLAARDTDRRGVRRVLARRSSWLVAFGLLHAALLYEGDILAAYGATGLIALAFLHRSRTTLVVWFWGATALATGVGTAALLLLGGIEVGSTSASAYLASVGDRLATAAFILALAVLLLFFVPQVVLGILLARSGWLTRPWEHRRRLGQVVVGAFAVNLVGNLPFALAEAHVWQAGGLLLVAHLLSGVVMGLGYVCLFGWLAAVWHDRREARAASSVSTGVLVTGAVVAVTAVGERSLTCYLLQSVMFAPLLSAWGFGLGGRIGTAQAAALAVGVWLVTVAVAVTLARAGRRGPFEVLLRRLMYRPGRTERRAGDAGLDEVGQVSGPRA